ncbi:MAG: hypothetical protein ACI8V5_002493, partial [Limisphaerales bacterium]
ASHSKPRQIPTLLPGKDTETIGSYMKSIEDSFEPAQ